MRPAYVLAMSLAPGTHTVGPGASTLKVKTYREGMAAKVGHDLTMEVTTWDATVDVAAGGAVSSVVLNADPASIQVREGVGGAKPLSDKDRGDIHKSITGKVLGTDTITFRSSGARLDGGTLNVDGELSINGNARPASFALSADDAGAVTGTLELTQTAWGIKPYKGLMGALKVRDEVEIVLDARLPAA